MFSINAELFSDCRCELAEGPVWDEAEQRLLWLDIKRNRVHSQPLNADTCDTIFDMGQNIGCMALRKNRGMILGMTSGIYLTDSCLGYKKLAIPTPSIRTRFNDGKCDRDGRFWAGTINLFPNETGISSLYCVLPDHRVKRMLDGVTNSNGLAFSEDMRTLYYIDTPTKNVDAFDVTIGADGFPVLSSRRTVVRIGDDLGWPDGMTIDTVGRLWVALWGSGMVGCFSPESGDLLGGVSVPVQAVSSCCFGGSDMRTLFVTTAREGLLPEETERAGNVYCARLDIPGVYSHRFNG